VGLSKHISLPDSFGRRGLPGQEILSEKKKETLFCLRLIKLRLPLMKLGGKSHQEFKMKTYCN
jgi:hypothetical protein